MGDASHIVGHPTLHSSFQNKEADYHIFTLHSDIISHLTLKVPFESIETLLRYT